MLHDAGAFTDIDVDATTDPELAKFIEETLTRGPRFSNYEPEKIRYFVSRIYELRKDNGNNTAG